jgi:hypothetical protein
MRVSPYRNIANGGYMADPKEERVETERRVSSTKFTNEQLCYETNVQLKDGTWVRIGFFPHLRELVLIEGMGAPDENFTESRRLSFAPASEKAGA